MTFDSRSEHDCAKRSSTLAHAYSLQHPNKELPKSRGSIAKEVHAATLAACTGHVSYSYSTMYCLSLFGESLIDSISPVLYSHLNRNGLQLVVKVLKGDGTYFVD